eukprot:4675172-Pyramimonas_sp.AAC.1
MNASTQPPDMPQQRLPNRGLGSLAGERRSRGPGINRERYLDVHPPLLTKAFKLRRGLEAP